SMKPDNGQPSVFEKLNAAPTIYKLVRWSPALFAILALIAAAVLIYAHDNRRAGLHNIAVSLIGVGVVLILSTIVLVILFNKVSGSGDIASQGAQTRSMIVSALKGINHAFNRELYIYSASYVAVGV